MPIIDDPDKEEVGSANLLAWLLPKLDAWKRHRDTTYKDKWNEYYRLWRGIFIENDKNRKSERSKLIAPALSQAIEASVSEIEEASFGRGTWFDMYDDAMDKDPQDIETLRAYFKEDLEREGAVDALCDVVLIAALYGTGIGEILVEKKNDYVVITQPIKGTTATTRGTIKREYFCVRLNPLLPSQLLVDPAATTVINGIGIAVEDIMPKHQIIGLIQDGTYNKVALGEYIQMTDEADRGEFHSMDEMLDKTKVIRYYGKVPKVYLSEADGSKKPSNAVDNVGEDEEYEDPEWEMVEAIVIIANDKVILKASENPYFMQDRPIIAFQWDRVPKKFWGRGVAEKGFNPQKALDAELRMRIDALALISNPMVALDATRLPRGAKFEVYPGASVLTTGNPNDAVMPFVFGNLNPATFNQSGDMERMVQMATGAMDTAAPIGQSPRNSTSGGMSMMLGASIKRAKRNLLNFQNNFLIKFIAMSWQRYVQFDPKNYPTDDLKFTAVGTLGIMAREFEQQLFIQLLSVTPKDSPVLPIIVKGIVENSSITNRDDLLAAIEKASQPDPMKQQMEMMQLQTEIEYKKAQTNYLNGQLQGIQTKAQLDMMKLQAEHDPMRPDAKLQLEAHVAILKDSLEQRKMALEEKKVEVEAALRARELEIQIEQTRVNERNVELTAIAKGVPPATVGNMIRDDALLQDMNSQRQALEDLIKNVETHSDTLKTLSSRLTGPKNYSIQRDENGNLTGLSVNQQ